MLNSVINVWLKYNVIRTIESTLVTSFRKMYGICDKTALLVLLLSERTSHGQTTIILEDVISSPEKYLDQLPKEAQDDLDFVSLGEFIKGLSVREWVYALKNSNAVSTPKTRDSKAVRPLVLIQGEQTKVTFERYYNAELKLAEQIRNRLTMPTDVNLKRTNGYLTALFGNDDLDWQKMACAISFRSMFSVITGGPGTGKTTTVLKLLTLLQADRLSDGKRPLVIRLAAPTGKAAARLNESLSSNINRLDLSGINDVNHEQLLDSIPKSVSTVHTLLGSSSSGNSYTYNELNNITADVLVVDESSMMDLESTVRLFTAVKPTTRIILLGDKDQLTSVGAGYVLSNICRLAIHGNYSASISEYLRQTCGIALPHHYMTRINDPLYDAVCMLRKSYRFKEDGSIKNLAAVVNYGEKLTYFTNELTSAFFDTIDQATDGQTAYIYQDQNTESNPDAEFSCETEKELVDGFSTYLKVVSNKPTGLNASKYQAWGKEVLKAHRSFQVIVAQRNGPWGVSALNDRIEALLIKKGLISKENKTTWYVGRPVMNLKNDKMLSIANGDVGICLQYPINGQLVNMVVMLDGNGEVRWLLPSRLPNTETVFAMTAHKSQGSEFGHTLMILPSVRSPIITKELLYTVITRSVDKFTLVFDTKESVTNAILNGSQRESAVPII